MRHRLKYRKLNRTSAHRISMLKNMSVSLVLHEQIFTTLSKAKSLRMFLEPIITLGKKIFIVQNSWFVFRQVFILIGNHNASKKIVKVLSLRYKFCHGGYLRIIKSGYRKGDMAPMAYIHFIDSKFVETKYFGKK